MRPLTLAAIAALTIPSAAVADIRYVGRAVVDTDDFKTHVQEGAGATPNAFGVNIATSVARAVASDVHGGTVTAFAQTQREVAGAQATLAYTLELIGPDADFVPIRVQAYGQVDPAGNANALAAFAYSYYDHLDVEMDVIRRTASKPSGPEAFVLDEVIYMVPNSQGQVLLTASAGAGLGYVGPDDLNDVYAGFAFALVDPVFTIDPAYAGRYQLFGVPGAVAAVPEPAAWGLMILGFAAAGLVLQRRASPAVSA